MKKNRSNVLVTGGAGYLGSHIIKMLISNGFFVVSIDKNKSKNQYHNKKCIFVNGNIGNKKLVKRILEKYKIDIVIHLAGLIRVEESFKKPSVYFKNNVDNSIILLEAMRESGVNKIIFSSSAAVYGLSKKRLISERNITKPVNPYGATKIAFEKILLRYNKKYGFSCISFRIFNVAGADPSGKLAELHKPETHIIPKTIQSIIKNKPVIIYGNNYKTSDNTCVRDYIHVNDVSSAFLSALLKTNKIYRVFNLGCGKGHSVREVVDQCSIVLRKKPRIIFKNRRVGDPVVLIADNSKVKKILKWKPKYTLKEMILHTVKSQSRK